MQNLMFVPKNELVISIVSEHMGERKHLDDWTELINSSLPRPRRFTRTSLSQVIRGLGTDHLEVIKEKKNKSTFYEFNLVE